jgi:potassium-dependent mechanosensitive channel
MMTLLLQRLCAPLLFVLLLLSGAHAQETPRAQLDKVRAEITALEREVEANMANDRGLAEVRGKVEPLQDKLREFLGEQQPRLDAAKARLEQLGPKPDAAKAAEQNADVAKERDEQEKAQREAEGLLALGRNHTVALEQIASRITDQRRALLAKALLERSASILSPVLWMDVARALPAELRSASFFFGAASAYFTQRADLWRLLIIGAFLLGVLLVAVPAQRFLHRFENRPALTEGEAAPPRLKRALAALRVTLIWAVIPAFICLALYNLLMALDLVDPRLDSVLRAVLSAIAFVAFVRGLTDGLLAPDDDGWQVITVDPRSATTVRNLATTFATIVSIGKVVEALSQAIYAVLPVTVASKGLFALLAGLTILRTLRSLRAMPDDEAAETADSKVSGAVRLVAFFAAASIILAAVFGYVALATFLTDQVIWVVVIGSLLLIALILADEYIGKGIAPEGRAGKQIMGDTGLSRSALKQVSVLSNGLVRVILFMAGAMLLAAPWGLDGGDMFGTLRAALFGFSIGGVTISISTVLTALGLFIGGFAITRAITRWLEKSYLPHTRLDSGLRNSIATSIGYVGIIIATMVAASAMGLSLDRLTLVAGALSVGIGFGLQSIVNNFVSGLILLWERPIKVGDWIVVGEEQGIVKRINVRSTQIETFDRASLIVPNAEFISGKVKNWMHNDRIARVVVPIGVGYGSDPERVKKLLTDVAVAHKDVLKDPHPRVYFMRLGDATMDFELRCFVDVDKFLPIKSELLFEILKRLRASRIDIPMPRRPKELLQPPEADGLDDAPEQLADADIAPKTRAPRAKP